MCTCASTGSGLCVYAHLIAVAVAGESKGPSELLAFHLQPNTEAFAFLSHEQGRDL